MGNLRPGRPQHLRSDLSGNPLSWIELTDQGVELGTPTHKATITNTGGFLVDGAAVTGSSSSSSATIYKGHGQFDYVTSLVAPTSVTGSDLVVNDGHYNAFPWVCVNKFGTLVAVYREAATHISNDGKIAMQTSADGGQTWSSKSYIATPGVGHDYRTGGGIICTHTGRLIVGMFDYNGSVGTGLFYVYSDDGGATWTSPIQITPTPYSADQRSECAIFQHSGGRLIWPLYGQDTGDSADRNSLLYSDDDGLTWSSRVNLTAQNSGYNEWYMHERPNGTLVAHVRTDTNPSPLRTATSTDVGLTWSGLTTMGWNTIPSRPCVVQFRISGALMQFYRDTPNGYTFYKYSFDDGATWSSAIQVRAVADEYVGGGPISDNLVGVVYSSQVTTSRADVRYLSFSVVPVAALAPGQGSQITAANDITVTNQMHQVTGTTTIKNIFGYIPSGAVLTLSSATILNFDSTGNVYATGASGTRAVPANSSISLVYDGTAGNWRVCGVGT